MTRDAVVVTGPPGCGKTTNAKALMEWYGCTRVVDGWHLGSDPLRKDELALTTVPLAELPKHMYVCIPYEVAARSLGIKRTASPEDTR